MKLLLFLLFAFLPLLPAHSQTKLVLENRRTGRQKAIAPGSRIKIRYVTRYEGLKVRQQGRVLALTDSALTYVVVALPKDTVTVALAQITALGKYNRLGTFALAFGTAAASGITAGLVERERGGGRAQPTTTLLAILGATLLYNGLDAVAYPLRRVNGPDTAWRLKTTL